ncbi:MAG: ATP synthase F1 subunit epsilon [Phycisphaerales bacterium]|nr:ATP synthase F1 subunit epsilon [Phycisphaerales bacterium]
MSNTFQCSIITPEGSAFEGEATYTRFPAWDGQYGMMAGLAPMLSRLSPGGLRIDRADGQSDWYLIEGGFAHVTDERLTVLAESATAATELDVEESEAIYSKFMNMEPDESLDRETLSRQQQIARERVHMARRASGFTTGV